MLHLNIYKNWSHLRAKYSKSLPKILSIFTSRQLKFSLNVLIWSIHLSMVVVWFANIFPELNQFNFTIFKIGILSLVINRPHLHSRIESVIMFTALKSPSLIFALWRSETYSPSLEFAHTPIFLHNPSYTVQ